MKKVSISGEADMEIKPRGVGRYPSSVASSYRPPSGAAGSLRPSDSARTTSVTSSQSLPRSRRMWTSVKNSVVNGTLTAVGLKPTRGEGRHWDALKANVLSNISETTPLPPDASITIQASHHPRDTPLIRHLSRRGITSVQPLEEVDAGDPFSPALSEGHAPSISVRRGPSMSVRRAASIGRTASISVGRATSVSQQGSVYKATGRNQALPSELKPDLWKLAFNGIRATTSLRKKVPVEETIKPTLEERGKSFDFLEDEVEPAEAYSFSPSAVAGISPSFTYPPTIMEEEEEEEADEFFGYEHVTSLPSVRERELEEVEEVDGVGFKPKNIRREKIHEVKRFVDKVTLSGGYRGGGGGLGAITRLLNFKYKNMSPEIQKELDNKLLHKRPYFTYWLMVVHTIILVIALAVYGLAPYGWDLIEERDTVRQTDLSFATVPKLVVPSVWGGPPQQALVLLGALFAPCMRRDRQLFERIEADRESESDSSGCCVRRDRSGCFQAESQADCQPRFSDFIFDSNDSSNTRAVCGTSPKTCLDPAPGISSGDIWVPDDVLTWPICREDINANSSESHLTCEVTSAPCCFGIQANCLVTTREMCDFLEGRFNQDAFLCSQVDCLNDICGLLPFREFNQPDQVYRLWIALFLHAGLIHLTLILLFNFFVLRHIEKRLGWWRTAVIYLFSGIGGNLVSAYFAPYNPEVGPAGSVAGVIAYFFVFLIFESPLLVHPGIEALKLASVSLGLFLLGLIPYVDNYAHIGGFVFGFLISGILVPYGNYKEVQRLSNKEESKKNIDRIFLTVKLVMIFGGLVAVLGLYVLFFVLLYVVQDTWVGFSYLTCIPFTSTLCVDQQVVLRDRDSFII